MYFSMKTEGSETKELAKILGYATIPGNATIK
jgi:hypothetical protein